MLLALFACAPAVPMGVSAVAKGADTGDACAQPPDDSDTPQDSGTEDTDHGSPENDPYYIDEFDDVANCASCHPSHYDEWHGSIHAYATSSPVMWAGSKDIGETTDNPTVCMGCHAPISTLTGNFAPTVQVVSDISQLFPAARRGVSCVACHKLYDVADGVNQFTHCEDWYSGTIEDPRETTYHDTHYSEIHTQALVCRSCHNVENLNGVQVEFTYSEWLDANFAAGGTEADPAIQRCQDCHMPAYTGTAAVGGPERTVHRHTFVGGDVALTPFPDSHRQYRAVRDLMRTAGEIVAMPDVAGDELQSVTVEVTNLVEGHDLPTGSAFDRQVWIELYVTAADGTVLLASGDLDENGDLRDWNSSYDPGGDPWISDRLSVFRSYLTDAAGAETFDFIGAATNVVDTSIPAGETRTVVYPLDATGPRPITVEARLLYRPYPPFLLREHELDEAVVTSVPVFEIARDTEVVE